jgi:chitinase
MVARPSSRAILFLSLGLFSLNLKFVFSQDIKVFALENGISAAADEDDYTCTATRDCKIGCCGAL